MIVGGMYLGGTRKEKGSETFYCLCWEPFRVGVLPRMFMERHWRMWIGLLGVDEALLTVTNVLIVSSYFSLQLLF
jgi:hypothetical protein